MCLSVVPVVGVNVCCPCGGCECLCVGASDVRHTFPRYVDPWLDVAACCTAQLVVVEGAVGVGLHDVLHRQLTLGDPGT